MDDSDSSGEALVLKELAKEKLFEIVEYLILMVNSREDIIFVNEKVRDISGYVPAEIRDKKFFDIFFADEIRIFFDKNEKKKNIKWCFVPLKKEKDKAAVIMSLGEDVTSIREMGNILERTKRLSEVGTLALTVVHELRNPLSVIKTAVYNLRRKLRDPLCDAYCATIDRKVMEADRIINDLLLYSKPESESSETFKIYDTLNECVETQVKRFKNPDININTDMDSVKNVYIEGDPLRLSEVFNNILANAYESFSGGKGIITVKAAPDEGGGLRIIFEDNGMGIDEDNKSKIFDPFFTTKSKGTGLGLSVCKQIINMHKGDIYAESKKEGGTVFTVILPLGKRKER